MTAQLLAPIQTEHSNQMLCCYMNVTNQLQIARISDVPNWYFERVVFPGQRLLFEAPPAAHLEIHTGTPSAILSDRITCQFLQVRERRQGGGEIADE